MSEEFVQSVSEGIIQVETFIACFAFLVTLILVGNVAVVLSDVLAFLAVIHQVWSLWKEKRKLRLHNTGEDFVTLLLQQVTQLAIDYISPTAGTDVIAFQTVLSTILICEFTLDLRQRNATRSLPNQSALELPDLNLSSRDNSVRSRQSMLGRLQESIIADMGERSDPVGIEGPGQGEPDP
ncbi:hypothetical protein Clacol_004620 [Clathrus columnatus]|uniref:Uncharacterized protein n=1 Tax=Clathrus columnatus TaxID=1419009 RepID=A0AAV5A6Z0_9AGAM|nr:hypothetical protein Clacol_004620 [Clathrus columnatus]